MSVLEVIVPERLGGTEIVLTGEIKGAARPEAAQVDGSFKGRKVGRALEARLLLQKVGARIEAVAGMLRDLMDRRRIERQGLGHVVAARSHESRVVEVVAKVAHVRGDVWGELQRTMCWQRAVHGVRVDCSLKHT